MKSKAPKPAPSRAPQVAVTFAVLAVVAVLAAVAWQRWGHDAASPANSSGASVVAASASPGASHTTLTVSASPSDAVIFIDDLPLEGNPYKGAFTQDGHAHRVRAEAKGHVERTDVVVFDKDDVAVTLTLRARTRIQAIDSDGRPIPEGPDAAAP